MFDLTLHDTGPRRETATPNKLVVAGWTGRDAAAVENHIEELEVLGVPPLPARRSSIWAACRA